MLAKLPIITSLWSTGRSLFRVASCAICLVASAGAASGQSAGGALQFAESNCGIGAISGARRWLAQSAADIHGFGLESLAPGAVAITYAHHSTFLIETPEGAVVATDFNDYAPTDGPPATAFIGHDGAPVTPDLATMNGAHDSHHTTAGHPEIAEMLLGWEPVDGARIHETIVGPVRARNVTTDVYRGVGLRLEDANSIFVFEIGDLCIGHLGHLHRPLTPRQFAAVGQLDIVFMPVDGVDLMRPEDLRAEANRLGAQVVVPMHAFTTGALARFVDAFAVDYAIVFSDGSSVILSSDSLPERRTLLVLREAAYR